MGRKERRAAERAEKRHEVRMTPARIQDLKERTAQEAVRRVEKMQAKRSEEMTRQALDMLILFGMAYLHREKKYGRKRLEDYYDGCMSLLSDFNAGKCTFRSLRDELVEQTGIQLSEV